jgi:hypothetical protein
MFTENSNTSTNLVMLSIVLAGSIAVIGLVGLAQAAPDLGNSVHLSANPLLLVTNAADPAGGHFMPTGKIAVQNVGEFTHVKMPSFLNARGQVKSLALASRTPTSQNSSLMEISEATRTVAAVHNTLPSIMCVKAAFVPGPASASFCKPLDAKLDHAHMPSMKQHAVLTNNGCHNA